MSEHSLTLDILSPFLFADPGVNALSQELVDLKEQELAKQRKELGGFLKGRSLGPVSSEQPENAVPVDKSAAGSNNTASISEVVDGDDGKPTEEAK